MKNDEPYSLLLSVPLSSPLHPKAHLPFLKGYLAQKGFKVRIIDTNILFLRWFLRDYDISLSQQDYLDNPVKLMGYYSYIEECLAKEAKKYRDFTIDLRTVGLAYNRNRFGKVLNALEDSQANPFIEFYDEFMDAELIQVNPKLIGIGITFQDNIIAAFTLANCIRKKLPEGKIVLGGQMITRCYDTLIESNALNHLWDYLVCWDGELPLLDLHQKLFHGNDAALTNVIENSIQPEKIDRGAHAFDLDELERPDFGDLNLKLYLFPGFLIPLQTARGCYGSCEFCAIPYGSNTGYRERSVRKIIEDILHVQEHTLKKYGQKAKLFKFMDDTSSPKTLRGIAEEIQRNKIDAIWETYVRMEKPFEDPSFMKKLYRGGCRKLMWGLETNDPEILKQMDKRISPVSTGKVLDAAHEAGILNFVFVLLGFPGETKKQRNRLAEYIINKESIHVLTVATFDVTKRSIIHQNLTGSNRCGIKCEPAKDFDVRLPYTVNGRNWKKEIVSEAQHFMIDIMKERPDIGLMSLCPDQIRGALTDRHGNTWGKTFLAEYGEENIRSMLLATEKYSNVFDDDEEMELGGLPDPLKREHHRTREDIKAIASAIERRRKYQVRRMDSI